MHSKGSKMFSSTCYNLMIFGKLKSQAKDTVMNPGPEEVLKCSPGLGSMVDCISASSKNLTSQLSKVELWI